MPPCTALALLAAGGWLCVLLFACALGKAAQRADARAERAAAPTRARFVSGRLHGGITSTHHHRADWCSANPMPGRAAVEPGVIEWFDIAALPTPTRAEARGDDA